MERRNLKQVVKLITLSWTLARAHAEDRNLCKERCGKQEMAEHPLFHCETFARVGFTMLGLLTKDGGFLQEGISGCILRYCRVN